MRQRNQDGTTVRACTLLCFGPPTDRLEWCVQKLARGGSFTIFWSDIFLLFFCAYLHNIERRQDYPSQ